MGRHVVVLFLAISIIGCGRKSCEPGSARACTCAESLEGAQVCNSGGDGYWACVCTPGEGVLEGDRLRERTTCRRMEVISDAAGSHVGSGRGCPKMADLGLDPDDAWGNSLVVVCSLEGEAVVTSSGADGRFGSTDDLTADACGKIEKFGSIARYEEAMRRKEAEELLARSKEQEAAGSDDVEEYVKAVTDASTGSTTPRKPPRKPPRDETTATTPASYHDPIAGIDDKPKKKKKHK